MVKATTSTLSWIPFYTEFADKLLEFKDRRPELIELFRGVFSRLAMKFPKVEADDSVVDLDPFTVFGFFNKGITDTNRKRILSEIKATFGISADVPSDFLGIPLVNNQSATFFYFLRDGRGEQDIDNLWEVFGAALTYDGNPEDANKNRLANAYDTAELQRGVKWNLTMGLYWCRPYRFINLDSRNRWFMEEGSHFPQSIMDEFQRLENVPSGTNYLYLCRRAAEAFAEGDYEYKTIPEFSVKAWLVSEEVNAQNKTAKNPSEGGDAQVGQIDGSWWPSAEGYDPGISTDDWVRYLTTDGILTDNMLTMLRCMKDIGGEATCSQLHDKYGESFGFYLNNASSAAERIAKVSGCPLLKGRDKKQENRWWPVLFVGKEAPENVPGNWIWRLRPELNAALNQVDLSGIPLYAASLTGPRYWLYAPGENAAEWDDFYERGVMGLGWEELGNLSEYSSKEAMRKALLELLDDGTNKSQSALATWQFANEVRIGDIIFAKRGRSEIVGRGVVDGEYYYDKAEADYPNLRKVSWTHKGTWALSGKTAVKTLTDITMQKDLINTIESFFGPLEPEDDGFDGDGVPRDSLTKRMVLEVLSSGEALSNKTIIERIVASGQISDDALAVMDKNRPRYETRIRWAIDNLFKNDQLIDRVEIGRYMITERGIEWCRSAGILEPVEPKEYYAKGAFLHDVFMREADVDALVSLLRRKKNVILQGAPGTGKTYAAKRLAYLMMGERDASRVKFVQFHQNTAYDDIVCGYRPKEAGGYELDDGVFVQFCRRATADPHREYFFIIDEINRANISKVFGELLMAIEKDHREEEIVLSASGRPFAVPENVFIIGMMNTADRGLALIDYALRRRFAFFEMKPALDHPLFRATIEHAGGAKLVALVDAVSNLNDAIAADPSLGRGFRIGHSYFCDASTEDAAQAIIRYEIAPLLEEYWFDDPKRAETEIRRLEDAVRMADGE